jgi:hypothetical protein
MEILWDIDYIRGVDSGHLEYTVGERKTWNIKKSLGSASSIEDAKQQISNWIESYIKDKLDPTFSSLDKAGKIDYYFLLVYDKDIQHYEMAKVNKLTDNVIWTIF